MNLIPRDFGFSVGQRVLLVEPAIEGLVQQILFSADGIQFQIAYWDGPIRRLEWVFPSEIASVKSPSMIEKT